VTTVEQARALRAKIDAAQAVARRQARAEIELEAIEGDDIDAVAPLFPAWTAGVAVAVGDLVRHDGILYKCVQSHTTQADWAPPVVPALWTPARQTSGPVVDEWVQPTGAHDAYNIGDRVLFNGSVYESTINGNVWSPTGYPQGWRLIT
jgi:hypothetical protein